MSSDTAISVFDATSEPAQPSGDGSTRRDASAPDRPLYRRPWVIGVAALVVVLIGVGVWWFAIRSDDAAATATTVKQLATVTTGSMSTTVSAEGTVAAAETDDLDFTASGQVDAVNVKAGDKVTAGQVLATIDSAELQSAVTSAESNLASAQATLSDDEDAGASSAQISADEANVNSAQSSLTTAQKNLDGAKLVATFDGTVSKVNVTVGEQLGSSGSGGTTPTGSASGSGQTAASLGSSSNLPTGASSQSSSSSSSSDPQIQVVSKGRYTVELPMDTDNVTNVKVGQSVTLTVTTSSSSTRGGFPGGGAFPGGGGFPGGGFPGGGNVGGTNQGNGGNTGSNNANATGATATGTVTDVSSVADTSSGVAKYPVTVAFDADSSEVYVGATVSGAVATDTRTNVLQVSSRAITTANGVSTVTVATKGTLNGPTETRQVSTGLTANGMTEITSGLRSGEQVVISVQLPGNLRLPTGNTGGGGGGFQPPSGFQPPAGFGGGS